MTTNNTKVLIESMKEMLTQDGDLLRNIIQQVLQEMLEAEMDQALGVGKSERSDKMLGYRSGLLRCTLRYEYAFMKEVRCNVSFIWTPQVL